MTKPPDPPGIVSAALFDFDETMIDLESQHDEADRALCRDQGADYDALPESFRLSSGRRIVDSIAEMRRHFGWSEDLDVLYASRHQHFMEAYRSAELAAMPGVERIVQRLAATGIRLAVTTSADADAVDEILARLRLRGLFTTIVGGSEVRAGKPDPEPYLVTANKLDVAPEECVVFEDSQAGVLAAKHAGMFCFAVRNPRARQRQDLGAADVIVDSFEAIDTSWFER